MGFLALSLEPNEQLVINASAKANIGAKVAVAKSEVLGPLGVSQVPSTIFLRKDGILNAVASGPRDLAWLERRIEEIVP